MVALTARQVLLVLGAVILLTFLFVKTQAVDHERHDQIIDSLRQLKHLEATLNEDILRARAGARNYFADRGDVTEVDYGRFNVTGEPIDRFVFKVPSLRNIELTAPYLHDGSAPTLEAAVEIMAKYNLGRPMTAENTNVIVAFLKTLTGEYKGKPLWSR